MGYLPLKKRDRRKVAGRSLVAAGRLGRGAAREVADAVVALAHVMVEAQRAVVVTVALVVVPAGGRIRRDHPLQETGVHGLHCSPFRPRWALNS